MSLKNGIIYSANRLAIVDDVNLGKKFGDYYFHQLSELLYEKIVIDPAGKEDI